ncbi:hypothetical protein A3Q56_01093 [Intoshia linei]|uniref:FCP1 homology domain-containing protein n=1 Tax=Intoshia linei TaxID=1819745 RepID=A0A177BA67_9BILA|nr:hypothetical protein A3Q56_01093 [Intoshia linei]
MKTRARRYSITPKCPFLSPVYPIELKSQSPNKNSVSTKSQKISVSSKVSPINSSQHSKDSKNSSLSETKDIMSDSTISMESSEKDGSFKKECGIFSIENVLYEEEDFMISDNYDFHQPYLQYDDDDDAFDFIGNLPSPESLPPLENILPPKTRSAHRFTLVMDLDETMVHCDYVQKQSMDYELIINYKSTNFHIFASFRPYLFEFLEKVSKMFELICFTASERIYADPVLDKIDPHKKIFRHRLYRKHCRLLNGGYVKDLNILGRNLARTVIIDNSTESFGLHLSNGIPINSWYSNQNDYSLKLLVPFLEELYYSDNDVRDSIYEKFHSMDRNK